MAPYAIAHMKIGLKLAETGYRFGTEERARIYLTNALEPKVQQLPQIGFDALAHEAAAVNEIKWYKRFTVVIGNPPYSGHSANDSAWAEQLLKEYYSVDGAPLGERNPKWLQDDYVKFIRLGQELMRRSGVGVFGFITNHGYIDNPTFRGMRQSLLRDFTRFHALDLHGNTKKEERSPDGSADGNVFDIQQGVAVLVATKTSHGEHSSSHCDLFGTREVKYKALAIASVSTLDWNQLAPSSPFYLLHPQNIDVRAEYDAYVRITDVLPVNVLGFQTHRDHFAIDSTEAGMRERIGLFRAKELSDAAAKERFEIKDADGWNVHEARTKLRADRNWEAHFTKCLYRPFDTRWCYFNGVAMDRPRRELLNHVVHRENICLLVPRQIGVLPWQHVCVSRLVAESCVVSTKTKEQNYNFPLWTFPESDGLAFSTERRLNLAPSIIRGLGDALGLQIHKQTGLPAGLTPEDIFHYAYAVFHSPGYRSRYAEFLKIDFPRLPLTGNLELFRALARLGGALTALHLLESPQLAQPITEYIGGRSPEVEKPTWSNNTVWVDKAQTTGFRGVPEAVWNFHIGGYQVCAKWLKDRKGRTLSAEDIAHYQKIVVALSETIRLMAEIDEVIEKHGGWPLK
jgi:predicted helicase